MAAWAQLFGLVSFEIFGQFNRVVEARKEFFAHAVAELGRTAGLRSVPDADPVTADASGGGGPGAVLGGQAGG